MSPKFPKFYPASQFLATPFCPKRCRDIYLKQLYFVYLNYNINNIYDTERHLEQFLERLNKAVIDPLTNKKFPDDKYFLGKTNFPPLYVHLDPKLISAKYKSYYVHNKMLIIYKNVRQMNSIFEEMMIEYKDIIRNTEFLITRDVPFKNQQEIYLDNNNSFADFVRDAIDQLQIAKKIFAQTKMFNLKLLNKQRLEAWFLEGISFKYFLNKKSIEKYKSSLGCLDRIDSIINKEVEKVLQEIEEKNTNPKKKI